MQVANDQCEVSNAGQKQRRIADILDAGPIVHVDEVLSSIDTKATLLLIPYLSNTTRSVICRADVPGTKKGKHRVLLFTSGTKFRDTLAKVLTSGAPVSVYRADGSGYTYKHFPIHIDEELS